MTEGEELDDLDYDLSVHDLFGVSKVVRLWGTRV